MAGTFQISLLKDAFIGKRVSSEKLDHFGWERQSTRMDGKPEGPGEPWVHSNTFLSQKDTNNDQRPEFEEYIILALQHSGSKIIDIFCAAFAKPDVPEMGVFEPHYLFRPDYDKAVELISQVLA